VTSLFYSHRMLSLVLLRCRSWNPLLRTLMQASDQPSLASRIGSAPTRKRQVSTSAVDETSKFPRAMDDKTPSASGPFRSRFSRVMDNPSPPEASTPSYGPGQSRSGRSRGGSPLAGTSRRGRGGGRSGRGSASPRHFSSRNVAGLSVVCVIYSSLRRL
jgi:hypothetical protein